MINFLFANILQTFKASIPKAGQKTTKRGLESSRSTLSLFLFYRVKRIRRCTFPSSHFHFLFLSLPFSLSREAKPRLLNSTSDVPSFQCPPGLRNLLAFLSSLVIVDVAYVTAVPTKANPAKNGHIFLPSLAAVRRNDSEAYGIFVRCCCCCCLSELWCFSSSSSEVSYFETILDRLFFFFSSVSRILAFF